MTKNIPLEMNIDDEKEKDSEKQNKKVNVVKKSPYKSKEIKDSKPIKKENIISEVTPKGLRKAFVLSEILQKPLALRRRK